MTTWKLWTKPRAGVIFLLVVESVTLVAAGWALVDSRVPTGTDLVNFAVIVALGLLAAETSRKVERIRRHMASTVHINLSSVWTLPAALLTTPSLTVASVAILYGHLWIRIWRRLASMYAYRVVFSASMVVLCCLISRGVVNLAPEPHILTGVSATSVVWIALVVVIYAGVNAALAAGAIALLQDDHSVKRLFGTWQDNSIELATLCMGMIAAVLLAAKAALVLLILMPLYVLHRSVLIRQLEHAATTDDRTGLLNATSWQTLAQKELQRAGQHRLRLAVLMVDLDHFKQVNDAYGQDVGDTVLRAVADAMREQTGDYDLCGRLGGEEFVVLLPDCTPEHAMDVSAGICTRIRTLSGVPGAVGLRLSASIGVAVYPDAGDDLEEIMLAADNAMFAAKDSGRDQVRAVMPIRRATES